MISRRSGRLLAMTLLALAVVLPALPASALGAAPKVAAPITSTKQTASHTAYCGPLLDKVCHVVCPRCTTDAATPASPKGAAGQKVAPRFMCAPDFEVVCYVVGQTLCRKYQCGLAPSSRRTATAAAPRWMCTPQLQTACYVVGLVLCHFHNCYANLGIRQLRSPGGIKQ